MRNGRPSYVLPRSYSCATATASAPSVQLLPCRHVPGPLQLFAAGACEKLARHMRREWLARRRWKANGHIAARPGAPIKARCWKVSEPGPLGNEPCVAFVKFVTFNRPQLMLYDRLLQPSQVGATQSTTLAVVLRCFGLQNCCHVALSSIQYLLRLTPKSWMF